MFNLRSGLKEEWIDVDLPDNTTGWRSEWFYIADQIPGLPCRTGHKPLKINEWDLGLSSRDLKELEPVLGLVSELKKQGVTGAALARSFCRRMIQPIKDRSTGRMSTWGSQTSLARSIAKSPRRRWRLEFPQMYVGRVKVKKCPKAYSLKRPADSVRS
jgi:hypothetical protein